MDDKAKWVAAAGLVGLVGFAVWQYMSESAAAARRAVRPREPWETL